MLSLLASLALALCQEPDPLPPLEDVHNLPPLEVALWGNDFNRRFSRWIEDRIEWDVNHRHELTAIWLETEMLWNIWWYVREARDPLLDVTTRRLALDQLRRSLGEHYYRGQIPPPIPVWRLP
jgi:hypothetical protein